MRTLLKYSLLIWPLCVDEVAMGPSEVPAASSRSRRGEGGFTIVEMTVALTVMMLVMGSFAYVMTQSLAQVSLAKQRQTANGLLDQTMEQVRALKYSAIQAGVDTTDLADNTDTTNVSSNSGVYTFRPNGETIVTATHSGSVPAPLYPHRSTTLINATSYRVGTYPTYFQASSTTYRVTVIVSWTPAAVGGISNQVSSQTIITSPGSGCLSSQNHPFAAPCQPFLYAQASSGGGYINITANSAVGNAILGPNGGSGVPLVNAELSLDKVDSTMQVEQIAKVQGAVQTSGATLNLAGSSSSTGGVSATAEADNDPASTANQYNSAPANQSAILPLSASGPGPSGNGISDTTSVGDSGMVVSTAAAATTPSPQCTDLGGTLQTSGLPCGSATVQQQVATSASSNLNLFDNGLLGLVSLGPIPLATVAASPTASSVFTGRFTSPSSTYCPATSGDGCVHAGAQRSIGTVSLGGLPTGLLSLLGGWGTGAGNFLVQLTGYSDSVSTESGVSTTRANAAQVQTSAPVLKYWNGSGYTIQSVNWGANPPLASIPTVSVQGLLNLQLVTVTISNTLVFGGTSTSTSGASPCSSGCRSTASAASPISGDIFYKVDVLGTTVASLDISVNLGTLSAQTNYQAAPSAS